MLLTNNSSNTTSNVVSEVTPENIIKGKFLLLNANIFEDPEANKGKYIDGEKKYTYNNETKKITFTIELKNNSNRDATEVIVVDTPLLSDITKPDGTKISKSNLKIDYSSMKWEDGTSVSAEQTTDGFKITNISISKGETKKLHMKRKLLIWIGLEMMEE